MNGKVVWALLASLLIVALLVLSCAPASTPPTTPTAPTTPKAPTTPTAPTTATTPTAPTTTKPVTPAAGQPKYGGILNVSWPAADPNDWDQAYRSGWEAWAIDLYFEKFAGKDWAAGPSGSGILKLQDSAWLYGADRKYLAGLSIESWEYPDPTTTIYHVRKGVKFHNKPPVNGREMTSNDVAVSLKRMWEIPTSWMYGERVKVESVTATDKYTVTIKYKQFDAAMEKRILDCTYVVPADVVRDASGKETEAMRNWKNVVGAGPFMMTDYVPGSSLTFVKHPEYWQKDPLHPANQLPYVDGLKVKVIPEMSTRLAALRSGAIDTLREVPVREALDMARTNPALMKTTAMGQGQLSFYMRYNIKPFSDKRVRQALSMAVDRDQVIKDLYTGQAVRYMGWVHPYNLSMHTPYEKLTPEGQSYLQFNQTKAKQLLADAGYPNGFDTEILTEQTWINEVVLVADYWKKIGVNAKVDLREYAVYSSLGLSRNYAGVFVYQYNSFSAFSDPDEYWPGYQRNYAAVDDSWWTDKRAKLYAEPDQDKQVQMFREMALYQAEQVWDVNMPAPTSTVFWQPYLKQFDGAFFMGTYGYFRPFTYVYLDKVK